MSVARILCVFMMLSLAPNAYSVELTTTGKIDITFNDPEFLSKSENRKLIYYAAEMMKAEKNYKPETYIVTSPLGYGPNDSINVSVKEHTVTKKEYLDKVSKSIKIGMNGTNISDSTLLRATNEALGFVGTPGSIASGMLNYTALLIDDTHPGRTPTLDDLTISGMGEAIMWAKENSPELYANLYEEGMSVGVPLDERIGGLRPTKEFVQKNSDLLQAESIDDLKGKVDRLTRVYSESIIKDPEAIEDEVFVETLERVRKDTQAGFHSVSMVTSFFGMPQEAKKISQVGQAVDLALVLRASIIAKDGSAAKLGSLVATQNYLALAGMVVEIFSGPQKSTDQIILEQLQVIQEMIADLSKKMDEHFARVDRKLDEISQKIDELLIRVATNAENIDQLRQQIATLSKEINQKLENSSILSVKNSYSPMWTRCLENPTYWAPNTELLRDQFLEDCIIPTVRNASDQITMRSLNIQPRNLQELAVKNMMVGQDNTLPSVLSGIERFTSGTQEGVELGNYQTLIYPELWLKYSGAFLDFVKTYPNFHSLVSDKNFNDIIDYGKNYVRTIENLLVESRTLKTGDGQLLNDLMNQYEQGLVTFIENVSEGKLDAGSGTKRLGLIKGSIPFDTSLPPSQQRPRFKLRPDAKTPMCTYDPKKLFSVKSITYNDPKLKIDDGGAYFERVKEFQFNNGRMSSLKVPVNFEEYMPYQLAWLARLKPDGLKVCVGHVRFEHLIVNTKMTRLIGNVRLDVFRNNEIIAQAQYPVDKQISSELRYGAFQYAVGVHQFYQDEGNELRFLQKPPAFKGWSGISKIEEELKREFFDAYDAEALTFMSTNTAAIRERNENLNSLGNLLFFATDWGLNDQIKEKQEIKNMFNNKNKIGETYDYLNRLIVGNESSQTIVSDIKKNFAELRDLFEAYQVTARRERKTLYRPLPALNSRINELEAVRDSFMGSFDSAELSQK